MEDFCVVTAILRLVRGGRGRQHPSHVIRLLCFELGKIVIVDPLVNASPVLTLFLSTLFLKDLESITPRVVTGAVCTVVGSILVVTV